MSCNKHSIELTGNTPATGHAAQGRPAPLEAASVTKPLGTWWWSYSQRYWDKYLGFAQQNGVNEIYFSTGDFSATTGGFIQKARSKGIKVFLLAGDYTWIHDPGCFISLMEKYTQYQGSVSDTQRFSGIHLDVEPHQDPEFQQRRAAILQAYIDYVVWVRTQYPTVETIDFDIPFWLDDIVLYKGAPRKLFEAVITEASRVFIMSYRDTAEKMADVSKEEIAFAASINKQLFLGAETAASKEGDQVTYFEEGKTYMRNELQKLETLLPNVNYGVSIHHMKSWYGLKN